MKSDKRSKATEVPVPLEKRLSLLEDQASKFHGEIMHLDAAGSRSRVALKSLQERIDLLEPSGLRAYVDDIERDRCQAKIRLTGMLTRLVVMSEFAYFSQMTDPKNAGSWIRKILSVIDEPDEVWMDLADTKLGELPKKLGEISNRRSKEKGN